MTATPAFYRRTAAGFVPTGLGISPWTAGAQMGACLGALLVHALETVPSPVPMLTARLTIDILGAVPMDELTANTRIIREGRRVQLVEAELASGGRSRVRGTALRVRTGQSPVSATPLSRPPPDPHSARSLQSWVQIVRLAGDHREPGPGATWLRFTGELIEGEPLTPLQAVTIAADFGGGTAPLVPFDSWTFANLDIAIHLTRAPEGEWLLVDAVSESAGTGVGLTHSRLGDCGGMIGMAHQTTFLNPR